MGNKHDEKCLHNSSKELELCNNISKKKRLAKCLEIKCIATGGCSLFTVPTLVHVLVKQIKLNKTHSISMHGR